MRRHALLMAAAVMAGCAVEPPPRIPPPNRFYFPTGLAHVDLPDGSAGALYVASSNFDKCYTYGQVSALALSQVPGLPQLAGPYKVDERTGRPTPVEVTDLPVTESERRVLQSFAGEMAVWPMSSGTTRLFIPARAEGSPLHVVEASGPRGTTLTCLGDPGAENCFPGALSLEVTPPDGENGLPRAPAPIGVAVGQTAWGENKLFVTHQRPAVAEGDTTAQPLLQTYVVEAAPDEAAVELSRQSFIPYGGLPAQSVAVGQRYAYVTTAQAAQRDLVVRLIDLHPERRYVNPEGDRRVLGTALGLSFQASRARGLAIDPMERRLYVAIRGALTLQETHSDVLLVADILEPQSDFPRLRVVRAVPLAPGVEQVRVIPRAGGNLVVVTSTGELSDPSRQGALSVYDDGLGQVVAEVGNIGKQPYGLAIDTRETGGTVTQARLFVSLFGEGRVAVLDIPDVTKPEDTWLVAYLGARQIDANESGRQSATCGVGE